jgi:glycosyltransferase involved in cell wall biosynthesis
LSREDCQSQKEMTPPVVSILTPCFNSQEFVGETLQSLLKQTYPYWESIIVDDGSSDLSKEIITEYACKDPRIRLYDRSRGPKGACTCRNEGVARSRGFYLVFLDTDDLLAPFCLAQRVAAMEAHPELDFAIFRSLLFKKVPNDLRLWWNVDKPVDELSRQFKQDAVCQTTGVIWRKEAFERIGMWSEDLHIWQDIDLFLRAFIQGYKYKKFFDLPPDLHYRVSDRSMSHGGFFAPEKTKSRAQVIRRAVDLLKAHGQSHRVREARFMAAEVISGATRSRQHGIAEDLLRWARDEGIFSTTESLRMLAAVGLYRSRAARLPLFRHLTLVLERSFSAEGTLGKLPVMEDLPLGEDFGYERLMSTNAASDWARGQGR